MNIMTIDMEDWFHPPHLWKYHPPGEWDTLEQRIIPSTEYILERLAKKNVKATFFILGWVADRHPGLVRAVASAGHEIASHGYMHKQVTKMTEEEFANDLAESVRAIQSACGIRPVGFRAPVFSITRDTLWALDILKAQRFIYDSSIYPTGLHPEYGISDYPLVSHATANGLKELPLSVARLFGKSLPCSGGGYFRAFPYFIYKRLVKRLLEQKRDLVFYIHPWELDEESPVGGTGFFDALRHRQRLGDTRQKFDLLLNDFEFSTVREYLGIDKKA